MNRTFALPKPPFRRRPRTASAVTVPAPVSLVTAAPVPVPVPALSAAAVTASPSSATSSGHSGSLQPRSPDLTALDSAATYWSAVDWAAVDWAAVDWAAVDWQSNWPPRLPLSRTSAATWSDELAFARSGAATPTRSASASASAFSRQFPVTVYSINEPTPGPRWKALFDATWPAYRSWYLSEGDSARPDLAEATAMLARHMPQLLPTYRRLVDLAGGDVVAARMLTMWNMPAFLPSCSQAVLAAPEPVLCRNYDYSPDLWEATIYSSAFTGRKVIGTGDCLWGLLDGMNDAGLVVSLTFGGRPGSGPGFAIPLVVRYLLEVAETAEQAKELLRGLPIVDVLQPDCRR